MKYICGYFTTTHAFGHCPNRVKSLAESFEGYGYQKKTRSITDESRNTHATGTTKKSEPLEPKNWAKTSYEAGAKFKRAYKGTSRIRIDQSSSAESDSMIRIEGLKIKSLMQKIKTRCRIMKKVLGEKPENSRKRIKKRHAKKKQREREASIKRELHLRTMNVNSKRQETHQIIMNSLN